MAERTEGTIRIEASPAEVMAVIADFESYPDWSGEIRKTEVLETDRQGRGKRVAFEISAGPINAAYKLDYVYHDDDGGMEWTFVEGSPLRNLEGEYLLEQDGQGTTVRYRLTVDPGIPMMGFMKRQAEKKIIDTALKGLKKRVESP